MHGLDVDFREVAIDGFEAVVVADDDEVAVGSHGACNADYAIEGAVDGFAHAEAYVDPAVGAVPTPSVG